MTLSEYAQMKWQAQETYVYHVVESLPETLLLSSYDTGVYHVYILLGTGESYATFDGDQAVDFMEEYNSISFDQYRGVVSSVDEITQDGYYIRVTGEVGQRTIYGIPDESDSKTIYEHTSADGWVECGSNEPNGKPIVVDTSADMDAILANATDGDVGEFYLYQGETTESYTNGAVYSIQKEDS